MVDVGGTRDLALTADCRNGVHGCRRVLSPLALLLRRLASLSDPVGIEVTLADVQTLA